MSSLRNFACTRVYIIGASSTDCAFRASRISSKLRGIRDVRQADLARLPWLLFLAFPAI
jgi:hypothetical protein